MMAGKFFGGLSAAISLLCCGQGAAAERGLPLTEATVDPGQVFPARLSEIKSDCSYRRRPESPILRDLSRELYSKHLMAAGEKSLVSASEAALVGGTQLRFTWLRSFHPPVVVRISVAPGGETQLIAKLLSGAGGYDPGEIVQQVDRSLDSAETRRIVDFVESSRLLEEPAETCGFGLDGARWIVEAVKGDSYYFLNRWSPEDGAVREFGLLMLSLTGWPIESEDIY